MKSAWMPGSLPQASCGWVVWVAQSLDDDNEPQWQKLIETSVLLDMRGVHDTELVDSFVAEMCGLSEVVFALAALIAYGRVVFSPKCHVVRDFCAFPGFASERFELSPVANICLLLRKGELFVLQTLEVEDGEKRSKRIKLGHTGSVFGDELPYVQRDNSE